MYEAGEGLRFDEMAVRAGVAGILRVLRHLDMLPAKGIAKPKARPQLCGSTRWLRSPAGGLLRLFKSEGDVVSAGEALAAVADPFGETETQIVAPSDGLIIGRAVIPVINEGDAVFHIGTVQSSEAAEAALDGLTAQLEADPMFDEDEII